MTNALPLEHDDDRDDDNGALLALAERMTRGEAVDWPAVRQTADGAEIAALCDIAAIHEAHRRAEETFVPVDGDEAGLERRWGHLLLLERIGGGQSGEVYRAFDTALQTEVALKLATPDLPKAFGAQLLQEARLLARIHHPNVVRVHGAEYRGRRTGFWMDLVRGRTLEEILKTQRFSAHEAARIGIDLCRALAAVHSVDVLHGDVKAHNVMRSDDGEVVLVDFSAGRSLHEAAIGSDIAGTLVYLAPEVIAGQPRSRGSDIYSLGVLLFHLVTDTFPVFASSLDEARAMHERGDIKRLRDSRPGLPDWFVRVVERATTPNPADRYQSVSALESALASSDNHTPSTATPSSQPRRIATTWRWAAAAAAIVIAIAGALMFIGKPGSEAGGGAPFNTTVVAIPPRTFGIEAAFYRVAGEETLEKLTADSVVKLEDQVSLRVKTTAPAYIYVVNEDELGKSHLLFPLPGQRLTNPLPPNMDLRLPDAYNWQVTSPGSKEHFLLFASAQRLEAFEEFFRKLPTASMRSAEELPPETLLKLRGVGGLAPVKPQQPQPQPGLRHYFNTPLADSGTVDGMWVRRLTVVNSAKAK